jgi:hypothetical protein
MLSTLPQDVTFAVRQFRRSPGFAVTAVLTLALGIGATTAIFSLIDGILLRPLPFPHPNELVAIDTLEFPPGVAASNIAAANSIGNSYPNFFDWRRQSHAFESLASYDNITRLFSKANGEGARVLEGGRTTANLFSTLGVAPALGRTFTEDEELPGHRVAILSHDLWVSDFGASPNAIGQTVKISDEPYTVIGVMPSTFHYPIGQPASYWSTYSIDAEGRTPDTSLRDDQRLSVVGRLKPGVSIKQALAELDTIQLGLAQQYSEDRYRLGVSINPLLAEEIADVPPGLSLLFAPVRDVLMDVKLVVAKDHRRRAMFVSVGDLATERSVPRNLRAVEDAVRVVLLRLVPQDDNGLVLDVNVGVVVVILVLARDAVADENHRQIEFSRTAEGQRAKLVADFKIDPPRLVAALGPGAHEYQRVVWALRSADGHFEFLKRGAVVQVGF